MSEIENQLPADIDTLHALMVAACAERDAAIAERETAIGERDRALSQIDRLRHLLRQLQRAHFGKRSEKLDPDQLLLTLEDIEQAIAESEAHDDKKDAIAAKVRAEKRRANRGALPRHLPRVDVTIAPEDTNCPCCRTPMHVIGEETSERLDVIPAQFRVIVTHRPKYACRACEEAPVQAPAPERLIKGGLPTEAMVAYVHVAPERLLRALLLQAFYTIRSERQLMEQLQYNLLYRWFVGLGVNDPVWVPTVFSKNRDRLLKAEVAREFLAELLTHKEVRALLSDEHFSVDGTQVQAWAR